MALLYIYLFIKKATQFSLDMRGFQGNTFYRSEQSNTGIFLGHRVDCIVIVRENVCNKTKKRKKSRFWILKKNVKNVKKT